MNYIDVHNHFLPGMDDGCKTFGESLLCVRAMIAQGYSRFFLTPHTGPTDITNIKPAQTCLAAERFSRQMAESGIHAEFRPGGELRLSPEMCRWTDTSLVPTYGMNTQYVLADLWEPFWPAWGDEAVNWLQQRGFTVILAHPERMACMLDDPGFIQVLADRGVLFQGNLGPLGGAETELVRQLAQRYLKEDRYFMLGTDGHRPDHIAFRMAGIANATDLVGEAKVHRLMVENPGTLWR